MSKSKKKREEHKATAAANRANRKSGGTKTKAKPQRRKRRGAREEQIPVECRQTPHDDLKGERGVLTLDYAPNQDKPHTGTFDPADEEIDNAEIAIYGFMRSEDTIAIQSEGPKWRFTVLRVSLDEDDEGDGLREDGRDA